MKITFSRISVVLLAATILFGIPFHIRADEETTNYSELFARTLTTDGAYTEILSDDIGSAFDRSPIGFLSALTFENDTVRNYTVMLLIYNQHVRGDEAYAIFQNTVLQISENSAEQDDIRALANRILEEMSTFLTQSGEKQPSSDVVIDDAEYAFDKDTIKNFIQLNLQLKNTDEGFFHTISQAYQSSPVAFASLVSEYSEADITYLAKGISYDFRKYGITDVAVSGYVGNDDAVSKALEIIQNQVLRETSVPEETAPDTTEEYPVPSETPDESNDTMFWCVGAAALVTAALFGIWFAVKAKKK